MITIKNIKRLFIVLMYLLVGVLVACTLTGCEFLSVL